MDTPTGRRKIVDWSVDDFGLHQLLGAEWYDNTMEALQSQPSATFDNVGIKSGGEWAFKLYDERIVNTANKLAKRYGVQVEKRDLGNVPVPGLERAKRDLERWKASVNFWKDHIESMYRIHGKLSQDTGEIVLSKRGVEEVEIATNNYKYSTDKVMETTQEVQKLENGLPVGPAHILQITPEMRDHLLHEGEPTFGILPKRDYSELIANLRAAWKKIGSTPGAFPGNTGPVWKALADIGVYHLRNLLKEGVKESEQHAEWAKRVAEDAAKMGLKYSKRQLNNLWDSNEMWPARSATQSDLTPRSPNGVLQTIKPMLLDESPTARPLRTDASDRLGEPAIRGMSRLVSSIWGFSRNTLGNMEVTNKLADGLIRTIEHHGATRPPTSAPSQYVNAAFDAAATRSHSGWRIPHLIMKTFWDSNGPGTFIDEGTSVLHPLQREATRKERSMNITRLLWEWRAQGLEQKNSNVMREIADIRQRITQAESEKNESRVRALQEDLAEMRVHEDTGAIPRLTPSQTAEILKDPAMQKFVKWFDEIWTPYSEGLSQELGIPSRLPGRYVSFAGRAVNIGKKAGESTALRGMTAQSPFDVFNWKARSSKPATGYLPPGKTLETDPYKYFLGTLRDKIGTIIHNDLISEAQKVSRPDTKPVDIAGRTFPVQSMLIGGKSVNLPQPYAELYRRATADIPHSEIELFNAANAFQIANIILLPADAFAHAVGVGSSVLTTEFFKKYGTTARVAEAMTGLYGKFLAASWRATQLHGQELIDRLYRVNSAAGFRNSGFDKYAEHRSLLLKGVYAGGPFNPFGVVSRTIKDFAFGHPGYEGSTLARPDKGIKGSESRIRMVIDMAMEEMDPTMKDPERARAMNDRMGTYVETMEPFVTKGLRKAGYAFSRARTSLTKNAIAAVTGRDITGKYNPFVHLATAATIAHAMVTIPAMFSKTLDDKHRWPWEIEGWDPLQGIMFDYDGHRIHLGLNIIANPIHRFFQMTGARNVATAFHNGVRGSQLTLEGLRGMGNFALSWIAPVIQTGWIAATGTVPYYQADRTLKRVSEETMGGPGNVGRVSANMKAALKNLFPIIGKGYEAYGDAGGVPTPTEEPWRMLHAIHDYFAIAPEVGPTRDLSWIPSQEYFRKETQVRTIAVEAVQRAQNQGLTGEKASAFVIDWLNHHIDPNFMVIKGDPTKHMTFTPANVYAFKYALALMTSSVKRTTRGNVGLNINTPQPKEVPK